MKTEFQNLIYGYKCLECGTSWRSLRPTNDIFLTARAAATWDIGGKRQKVASSIDAVGGKRSGQHAVRRLLLLSQHWLDELHTSQITDLKPRCHKYNATRPLNPLIQDAIRRFTSPLRALYDLHVNSSSSAGKVVVVEDSQRTVVTSDRTDVSQTCECVHGLTRSTAATAFRDVTLSTASANACNWKVKVRARTRHASQTLPSPINLSYSVYPH